MNGDFLTNTDTAARLNVSIATLNRWRSENFGPTPVRFRNRWFYPKCLVDGWHAEHASILKALGETSALRQASRLRGVRHADAAH